MRWRLREKRPFMSSAMDEKSELSELKTLAANTFEAAQDADDWFLQPHPMLDDEMPQQAAQTAEGARLVREILVAIKYGGVV